MHYKLNIKVWISWIEWETSNEEIERAREIYKDANRALEGAAAEERLLLLEQWKEFEDKFGSKEEQTAVEKMMPKRVKKRRQITASDGTDAGWEEYFDYIFPQDQGKLKNY
jgi:crooked neck